MRALLREEFSSGGTWYYLFGVTPFALAVSIFLPPAFLPFISALLFLPVFLFFVRNGGFGKAFFYCWLWISLLFTLVAGLSLIDIRFIESHIPVSWAVAKESIPPVTIEGYYYLAVDRFLESIFMIALSTVSGGALAMVAYVNAVCSFALDAARLYLLSGLPAVLLSVKPWVVVKVTGELISCIGSASVFYAKLERRDVRYFEPFRLLVLGILFVLLSVYLEVTLKPVWTTAFKSVM